MFWFVFGVDIVGWVERESREFEDVVVDETQDVWTKRLIFMGCGRVGLRAFGCVGGSSREEMDEAEVWLDWVVWSGSVIRDGFTFYCCLY